MDEISRYPDKSSNESVYYDYAPSLSPSRLIPHPRISAEFVNACQSGAEVTANIQITNWRILVSLAAMRLTEVLEICYCDLAAIRVSSNWLDPAYGVTLVDNTGLQIHLGATRPHIVAIDIWYWASTSVFVGYASSGHIDYACQLIRSWEIQTLSTPDDYSWLRSEQIDAAREIGFSFRVNHPPRFSLTPHMRESANAWYVANNSSYQVNSESSNTQYASSDHQDQPSSISQSSVDIVYLPKIQMGDDYKLEKWHVNNHALVRDSQKIACILCVDSNRYVDIYATSAGRIQFAADDGASLRVGQEIALISRQSELLANTEVSDLSISVVDLSSTAEAIKSGTICMEPGSLPTFMPSVAAVPSVFQSLGTYESDLQHAIENSPSYFQSFFNDLCPVSTQGIDDDIICAHCFDESLYSALVREMHRYTLAEVAANQDEIASNNAGLGAMVGSFLGLITGNIFAPFLGHSYGKNISDRSRRIEEFLPDPNLLFSQDPNSFVSWSRGQVSAPRLRRLIFDRQVNADNQVYFRLVPAIVTGDSVFPIQLFKINSSTYFFRPFAAGIGDAHGRKQANYDAIKVQRKYFHVRAEGIVEQSSVALRVYGGDIEERQVKLFRYSSQSLNYFYADFPTLPGSIF